MHVKLPINNLNWCNWTMNVYDENKDRHVNHFEMHEFKNRMAFIFFEVG